MVDSPVVIGFIFARGGSKGLPGKNIKPLGGKPLIAHAIEIGMACRQIDAVIVSTEDAQIAEVARDFGAETPFTRPAELAADDSPEWLSWQHAIAWIRKHRGPFDIFVSLPPTAPFRAVVDVENCIECLVMNPDTDIVLTGSQATRSPYFNMVKCSPDGVASLAIEGRRYARRQDAPELFDLTTVAYAARPDFVMSNQRIFDGTVRMVEVPTDRALDIDTAYDFEIAEFLASRKHSKRDAR